MLSVLLLLSLLGAPQSPAPTAAPSTADAAALARAGSHEAALDAFRRIAAANPRDHEARLWIARLHGWMGHPEQAEPVFRSVMLEDPSNVEATIGAGLTLLSLGRTDDGVVLLERALKLEPQNPDVLAALGRAHVSAGRTTLGLLYSERAVSVAPAAATRDALERARFAHGHRVEITSFGESYNTPVANTGSADVRVNLRLREGLRLVGRGQHQQKFEFSEQRGGAGLEWRWRPATALSGHILVGPRGNVVLPRLDLNAEVAHLEGRSQLTAGYRFIDFPSAQVSALSPGVTFWATDRLALGARYSLLLTDRPTLTQMEDSHAVALRGDYRAAPRVSVNAGYTRGTENLDTLSPDRVGDFRANTVSGGVQIDLRSLTSVVGGYEHQWRPDAVQMRRFTVSLQQRF